MNVLVLIFLIAALVCFVLAAVGVSAGRYNLIAAGLAFYTATLIPGLLR